MALSAQHETLVAVMADETAPPASRVSAAVAILDRGYGKPPQAVAATVNRNLRDMTDAELPAIIQAGERDGKKTDEVSEALHCAVRFAAA